MSQYHISGDKVYHGVLYKKNAASCRDKYHSFHYDDDNDDDVFGRGICRIDSVLFRVNGGSCFL